MTKRGARDDGEATAGRLTPAKRKASWGSGPAGRARREYIEDSPRSSLPGATPAIERTDPGGQIPQPMRAKAATYAETSLYIEGEHGFFSHTGVQSGLVRSRRGEITAPRRDFSGRAHSHAKPEVFGNAFHESRIIYERAAEK